MLVEFKTVILPLSTALGLSIVVERAIEFLRNLLGYFSLADNVPVVVDKQAAFKRVDDLNSVAAAGVQAAQTEAEAEELAQQLDKELAAQEGAIEAEMARTGKSADQLDEAFLAKVKAPAEATRTKLANYQRDREWNEAVPNCVVAWQSATGPSGERIYNEVAVHSLGLALGIILAMVSDLRLLSTFLTSTSELLLPVWLDYVLTGLLISAGSGPIHVLIRFISERKVIVAPEDIGATEEKESKTGVAFTPGADSPAKEEAFREADWIPIAYEGGVDKELLETVHRRRQDPKFVIFHHTAMNRGSTFEDVVRVIKSRKDSKGNPWLTGYNCVITEDGVIHPFCRWDRYGSHAAGYNAKSLGIAFNGNFETGMSDPYSNHDGRYGPSVPTRAQLEAGARVVALWILLYKEMDLSFGVGGCVFPHKQIAAKNCPGNMFPTDQFYGLVRYYHGKWSASPVAMQEIEMFRHKPFISVEGG